ncbi:MAG: hypothetical protein ACI906_000278 [Candidatus Latescibacterota bacterium]|jgi:hypothetical protein
MKLKAASPTPPKTLCEFLADLVDGENGFMGTRVHAGEIALEELQKLGERRALITTSGDNPRSIRIIEANSGQFCDLSSDAGGPYRRYWIDLTSDAHSQR